MTTERQGNFTSKYAFTEFWLFYDYLILFIFHNHNAKIKLVFMALDLTQGIKDLSL